MPVELTDLFERATAAPPAESHHAADITRLAAHRQRRRTATLAAAAAAVTVVVSAGAVVGLTGGHDTRPEPASGYRYDQHVDLSQAVPASSLPGYRVIPYGVRSVQQLGSGVRPNPTFREVDAEGRLLVVTYSGTGLAPTPSARMYDASGHELPLRVPPSPGRNGTNVIGWIPSFAGGGQLAWAPSAPMLSQAKAGFHLTDLDGGHDRFVHTPPRLRQLGFSGTLTKGHNALSHDHIWTLSYDSSDLRTGAVSNTLYRTSFSGRVVKVADHVAVIEADDATAVWVTTSGRVFTESDRGGPPREVDVPLDTGCRVTPTGNLQGAQLLTISGSIVALAERCGTGDAATDELLAFDLQGRRLVHVTGAITDEIAIAGDSLVFLGLSHGARIAETLRYDLRTGTLARLAAPSPTPGIEGPSGADPFVLWYDARGGHVARFGD